MGNCADLRKDEGCDKCGELRGTGAACLFGFFSLPPLGNKDASFLCSSRGRLSPEALTLLQEKRGGSEMPSCFCGFFKLLQLKIISVPRCHMWVVCPEPCHVQTWTLFSPLCIYCCSFSRQESAATLEKQIIKAKQPPLPTLP